MSSPDLPTLAARLETKFKLAPDNVEAATNAIGDTRFHVSEAVMKAISPNILGHWLLSGETELTTDIERLETGGIKVSACNERRSFNLVIFQKDDSARSAFRAIGLRDGRLYDWETVKDKPDNYWHLASPLHTDFQDKHGHIFATSPLDMALAAEGLRNIQNIANRVNTPQVVGAMAETVEQVVALLRLGFTPLVPSEIGIPLKRDSEEGDLQDILFQSRLEALLQEGEPTGILEEIQVIARGSTHRPGKYVPARAHWMLDTNKISISGNTIVYGIEPVREDPKITLVKVAAPIQMVAVFNPE